MKKYSILLCVCLFSCGATYDCDSVAESYRNDECLLIVKKLTDKYNRFDYKGIQPFTKKECDCNSETSDRWWVNYKEYIEIGDILKHLKVYRYMKYILLNLEVVQQIC